MSHDSVEDGNVKSKILITVVRAREGINGERRRPRVPENASLDTITAAICNAFHLDDETEFELYFIDEKVLGKCITIL